MAALEGGEVYIGDGVWVVLLLHRIPVLPSAHPLLLPVLRSVSFSPFPVPVQPVGICRNLSGTIRWPISRGRGSYRCLSHASSACSWTLVLPFVYTSFRPLLGICVPAFGYTFSLFGNLSDTTG